MRSTTKKKGVEMLSSLSHTLSSHDIPKSLEHRNWGPKLSWIKLAANLVLDADQAVEDNRAMTSLHVIQTVDCRVQPNPTYHREPRQRPCWPRSLGQLHVAHVIQVHLHKKKLVLFLPQMNFPFQASPKKSSMASNTKSWNKIPKPHAKTEREQAGESARARAD